jgi:hypothetical protein
MLGMMFGMLGMLRTLGMNCKIRQAGEPNAPGIEDNQKSIRE